MNNSIQDPAGVIAELTGLGADVTIEGVGIPSTFELAAALVRPAGHVANIGVHGEPATLHLEQLWIRDVTITTGLVDTYSTVGRMVRAWLRASPTEGSPHLGACCRRRLRRRDQRPTRARTLEPVAGGVGGVG